MKQFTVIWLGKYIYEDAIYTVGQTFSGNDVDDIFEQLDGGLERGFA